ncbi:MAG TPA: HEAT repeat domain-containing protein [Vicinamibacterales bacterium]|nr:HEAT repeat domain-containing protein [Vicinamibacterales bacterium]
MPLASLFAAPVESEQRRRRIVRLDDEAALVKAACEDGDLEVRRLALDRVSSPAALKRVALDGHFLDARLRALGRIDDQRELADIMRQRKNYQLMLACFARIADHNVLADIARDPGFNIAARRIAVQMFSEPRLLAEVLNGLAEPGLRHALGQRGAAGPPAPSAPAAGEVEARVDRLLQGYPAEVLAEALAAFRDSPGAVRAIGVLARRGGDGAPRAIEVLTRLLRHARPDIRVLAVEGLANCAPVPAGDLAAAAESDPDPRVRDAASRALAGAAPSH